MPFSSPLIFTVNVTTDDIQEASLTVGSSQNPFNNSLAKALQRLHEAKQLPGQEEDVVPAANATFFASTEPVINNGQLLSLCYVSVIGNNYNADMNTATIIAAENLFALKQSYAYTATLTRRNF